MKSKYLQTIAGLTIALILVANAAWAGGGSMDGGGGSAIGKSQVISKRLYLLDLFEARIHKVARIHEKSVFPGIQKKIKDYQIEPLCQKLVLNCEALADKIQEIEFAVPEYGRLIVRSLKQMEFHLVEEELPLVNDLGLIALDSDVVKSRHQVAIRNENVVRISKFGWSKPLNGYTELDLANKVALITHEVLYYIRSVRNGDMDSAVTRKANALLFLTGSINPDWGFGKIADSYEYLTGESRRPGSFMPTITGVKTLVNAMVMKVCKVPMEMTGQTFDATKNVCDLCGCSNTSRASDWNGLDFNSIGRTLVPHLISQIKLEMFLARGCYISGDKGPRIKGVEYDKFGINELQQLTVEDFAHEINWRLMELF